MRRLELGRGPGDAPPGGVVDAFHAALRNKDTAAALSLLDRGLVVQQLGGQLT